MERATEHAEQVLKTHNPAEGWLIVTYISHPNLFEAFETISHDSGFGAGHTNYSVPSEYTPEQLETFEAQLGMMTDEQTLEYVCGEQINEADDLTPELGAFLNHFFNDWEDEV